MRMYYLLIWRKKDLESYRIDFEARKKSIDVGRTPVNNEIRTAKTYLAETIPFNVLNGMILVAGTYFVNSFDIPDLIKFAVILAANNVCGAVSNYIFTILKHYLRLRICRKLGVEPSEENIAVMKSLEYQCV